MKHAGPDALDRLEPLLARLRTLDRLREKGRGVFYLGGRSAIHFHEDPAGLFVDVRLAGSDFERLRVETPSEQEAFLKRMSAALDAD